MVEVNRRGFLIGAGLTAAAAVAGDEKVMDGGLAATFRPGVPTREVPLVPPGSGSLAEFSKRCVGCQLCVQQCPNLVLRPSTSLRRFMQPEMGFDRGYCRPECTRCGEVCPAGAIRRMKAEKKRLVHVGRAVWHRDRCIAAQEGVNCNACLWHCPAEAIKLVPMDEANPKSAKVPVVDAEKCLGCGACEHLCPARPMPAMTVEGLKEHRVDAPKSDRDVTKAADTKN